MPTNEEVLNKLQADLQSRGTRGAVKPQGFQYSGVLDMPWDKGRIENVKYDVPTSAVAETDRYGVSALKYDNYLGAFDNEDRLAQQQSWGEKAGNGVTKFLGKTGLIAADALATVTYGLGSAISQGELSALWDNDASNFLDEQSKRLDRNFAHYYSNEEKAKSLLGQMGTANFWFNDVGNGLAFVAGTVLSEVPLAILSGGASLPSSFAKAGARLGIKGLAKSADNIAVNVARNNADDLISATTRVAEREIGTRALRRLNRSSIDKFATATNVGASTGEVFKTARFLGQSVGFEAGMEARHSYTDAVDKYVSDYQTTYGELPTAEDLTTFMKDAESTANKVFGANAALLSVTNFAMYSKMFDLKMIKFPKLGIEDGILGRSVTTMADGTKVFSKGTKAQRMLGRAVNVSKPVLREGVVEEGLQGVFGKTMSKYLEAKYDPKTADIHSFANALQESFVEQYTTKEGLKEVVIGGIIGLAGGNVGAAISKPLTALGVRGMEGASFGVQGLGKNSYASQLNSIDKSVEEYNKYIGKFRDLNRANSIGNFQITKETNQAEFTILEDSAINYSFIKANEGLKGYADTIADFEASVDGLEFTQEQQRNLGFESEAQVREYKDSLKAGFQRDYTLYQKANKTVESLGIENSRLPNGQVIELKDATTLALMQGFKAGDIVNTIGDNISALTGEEGAYSTLKFFNELQNEQDNAYAEYEQTKNEIAELTTAIAEVGAQMQSVEGNEVLAKELSKKQVALSNQLIKSTARQEVLETALNKRLETISYGETSQVPTINQLSERYASLNQYVETLRATGKTKEARELEFLLDQFDGYLALEANASDTIRRMAATNFYSSREGKGLISSILGSPYSMSEEAKKELRANEATINPILEKIGYRGDDLITQFEQILSENTDLSEREKFKIESMLRAQFAYDAIQRRVEESQQAILPLEEVTIEDTGDSIESAPTNARIAINNIEELSSLIEDITNEIDIITNKPTLENLRKIRENQSRIEELQKEISDIENGIVTPQVDEEQSNILGEPITTEVEDGTLYEFRNELGLLSGVLISPTEFRIDGISANEVGQGSGSIMFEALIELMSNQGVTTISTVSAGDGAQAMHQRAVDKGLLTEVSRDGRSATFEITQIGQPQAIENASEVQVGQTLRDVTGRISTVTAIDGDTIVMDRNGSEFRANPKMVELFTNSEVVEVVDSVVPINTESEIESRRQEIEAKETENNDLRTPFKFLESEGYKSYLKLLKKRVNQGTLTLDEQDEFETLENQVNQWISILGTTRDQLELSDLIKQLVALENSPVDFAPDVVEATDEEVIEDARIVNKSQNRNLAVGQNYEVAVSQEVLENGVVLTSIHNYTLDAFIALTGVEILETEVEEDPVTKAFKITREIVDRINQAGKIRITSSSVDETSTYYSMIRKSVTSMDGVQSWVPLNSDYDNDISREDVFNVRDGEILTLAVDPNNDWNRSIFDAIIRENANSIITDEQRENAIELEFQKNLNKNKTVIKLQAELLSLNNLPKTTANQSKINKKTQQVRDLTATIREKAENTIEAKESQSTTLRISPELRTRIATELRITAMNADTANVQVLKGTKGDDTGRFKGDDSKFASLRREIANDDAFLMSLILNNNETPSEYTIKVKNVYAGLPNFNTIIDEDVVLRQSRPIREQDLDKIADIGYVQNGKLYTRTSIDSIDKTFINTAVIANRSSKTPVVIIRQGVKHIAFPVRVSRNASPIDLNEFQGLFNNETLEGSEKAIRLNSILARAGIDVTQTGNAFIDLGNGLSSEAFDNLFSQLSEKQYLSSVDGWNDSRTSIAEALIGNVTISLDMSAPFVSPKIKFDLASIETVIEETPETQDKKKKSATQSAVNTVNEKAGLKNFNFCK